MTCLCHLCRITEIGSRIYAKKQFTLFSMTYGMEGGFESNLWLKRKSLVVGRWSLVVGRWSLVVGRWSLVKKVLQIFCVLSFRARPSEATKYSWGAAEESCYPSR